jgi:hypothetical protein
MNLAADLNEILARDFSLPYVLMNTLIVLVMAQVLAWHYCRFATVLSNRRKFARVLVFISVTTLLMISVVKTSLALSLGLVGALSIIRFRTPVKEAEELAYLFLAIAAGIGIGADQAPATITMFTVILLFLAFYGTARRQIVSRSMLHATIPLEGDSPGSGEPELRQLREAVATVVRHVDLRRVDRHPDALDVTLLIDVPGTDAVGELLGRIHAVMPATIVSVVDRDNTG